MSLIGLAAGCFIASSIGVAAFTRWARRSQLLDVPNHRSSHEVPTPRGAGMVIVVVVMAAILWTAPTWTLPGVGITAAALVIAAVSAVDDVRSLSSLLRLAVHASCALVAVLALMNSGSMLDTHWGWAPVGVVWLVGLTNAYNFMDGIDGIGGMQAVVAGIGAGAAATVAGLAMEANAAIALAAASAGFLWHNWPPARVFMGDVGSAFLGFSFGVLALAIGRESSQLGFCVPLSLWPFLFDSSLTLLRRAARGENVLHSHRSHLYQRLVIAGWSHARVTILYGAAAGAGAVLGFLTERGTLPAAALVLIPAMATGLWVVVIGLEAGARGPVVGVRIKSVPRVGRRRRSV